jgi:hypothetical protein
MRPSQQIARFLQLPQILQHHRQHSIACGRWRGVLVRTSSHRRPALRGEINRQLDSLNLGGAPAPRDVRHRVQQRAWGQLMAFGGHLGERLFRTASPRARSPSRLCPR